MKARFILIFLFLASLLAGGWFWHDQQKTPVPDALFTTITGKKIALKDLRGKPVIITFWATDCKSCIDEVPHLVELHEKYHARGLEIIAVAMYYDPPNHVVEMTRMKQIPYDVALDLRNEHAKAFGNVQLTPTTLLINPLGEIVFKKTGLFDMAAMESRVKDLLVFE